MKQPVRPSLARRDRLAFDRGTVRTIDTDGRMHVQVSNISKSTVNPYRGAEIPRSQELGLDDDGIYWLYRDPKELEAAAPTFNNLPLLKTHVAVSADKPRNDLIVGSTGTDAAFSAPYLQNSLVVWDSQAIAGIESDAQRELSCAYHYVADMTPGKIDGQQYDGVMRDIRGNHVALVEQGRAGPDVVVNDSNPFRNLTTMKSTRTAVAVRGALTAYLRPKLAADAAPSDLNALVRGVTQATIAKDLQRVVAGTSKLKLAQDMQIDSEELLDILESATEGIDDEVVAGDEETDEEKEARLAKEAKEKKTSSDEKDDDVEKKESKAAMDAAIASAKSEVVKQMQAVRTAENEVRPLLGDVVALDTAADVYKLALDHLAIDVTDVHPSAYRAVVKHAMSTTGSVKAPEVVAMDSAASKSYAEKYGTKRLVRGA